MKYLIVFLIAISSLTVLASDDERYEERYEYCDDKYKHSVIPESSTYAAGVFVLAVGSYVLVRTRKNKQF